MNYEKEVDEKLNAYEIAVKNLAQVSRGGAFYGVSCVMDIAARQEMVDDAKAELITALGTEMFYKLMEDKHDC